MQRKDGSFDSRYRVKVEDPHGIASLYYPGEAMLGLMRLYRLNGDKRLLEASRRGARFLIDSQRKLEKLPADAWLMQALEDRKSTRLNSSHLGISYAVFCLK